MYLIGDIGNTDIKICLFNNNLKLVKKVRLKTILLNKNYLSKNLKFIKKYKSKIIKVLISSVVPVAYKNIKMFIEKFNLILFNILILLIFFLLYLFK